MEPVERRTAADDDPISWRAARPGTPVYGSDGERAGSLRSVEGDDGADIFHGLVVEVDGREVLVPADAVGTLREDRIDVTMPGSSVGSLPDWSEAGASARPVGERETPGEAMPPAI